MLSIPTAQIGNRLYLDPRPLIPILVAWGAAMAVIGLEDDVGFAALLFVLFIGLLWVATGRVGYLVLGLVLFGVGRVYRGTLLRPGAPAGRRMAEPVAALHQPGQHPAERGLVQHGDRRCRGHRARLRPRTSSARSRS